MDDKQMQELNALEQAAFNDPVNFLNQEHNPRKWTLSSEDIARSYSITPAQLLHTEDELNPRKWNVAETLAREFGTGAINMFESAAEGIANSKLQKVIYRSNNMSKEDADRLVEDVLRSQVISRNRQNLEHARRVHDVWSAGIANGIGSVASMALVGAATKSPIAVGALTGIGEAYNVRNEMIDRYVEEKGTTEGVAGKLPEYNALSAAYGVVAGAIEGSIGVERLAAGSLNRYGKLAAMERLARQQGKYGKALAYKTGREFVASGAEEAGEEFLQSISEDVAVALVQDMWEDPDLKKALTQGMFGAIVGAPAGAIFYNGSRKRIIDYINKWNEDKKAGLTESQVVQMTDEILGNGAHTMVDDITTRVEIKEHFGKAYDLVKQRLTEQIDATGTTPWTDQNKSKEEYIQTLADSITIPAINVANILHIPLSDFLEIADINTATIAGNIAWLRPITSIADIDTIIANQDAIIKEQTEAKKLGIGNEDVLNRARQRKAIAQRVRKDLAIENGIRTQRSNRKKENADYITAKDLQPEQVQTLENATQAQPGQEYVLFAGKRIPVEYQVVELATIQPSHIDGTPNPAYTNTELQNRASRGTTQDVADLREKATNITPERLMRANTSAEGAPVVNAQGQVIAGNGRTEIIRYAYQNPESAEKYKQELVKQGFNIDGMQQPILVRRNTTMTDQEQVAAADISNISETSAFDEASQARRDTQYLKDSPTPTDFAAKLPMSERRGLMQNNGRWNKRKVQQRYESALLAWLCGNDTQLFENLVLDRVLTQKVIDVLTANGSLVYETATKYPELQIREDIYHALIKMQRTTRDNFLEITQQLELDGRDVMPENILVWNWLFADPTTNRQYLSNYATTLANNHENANAGQDMFGQQVAPLSKKDAIMQALKKTDEAKAELSASRGREYQPLFDENGMATDPNLVAAIASYQNQFAPVPTDNKLSQEVLQQIDPADENARLDDIYPAYDGETIVVDGKERTVYNSNGDRIAKSAEALTNFWRWFGNSKVVDEQGRPLVVYHGTNAEFSEFEARFIRSSTGRADLGFGYYFSSEKTGSGDSSADWYGNIIMPVYLKSEKPFIVPENDSYGIELGKKLLSIDPNIKTKMGEKISERVEKNKQILMRDISPSDILNLLLENKYDGVISGSEYVVHYSNQIKSVDNRGTYSSDTGNIYFQTDNKLSQEVLQQIDLADENARLDDIYPAYDGETIEVDGKERTVYNSNGDRIAKSKEALTNFWRWFGDSKVVDEQGRPLVVYHSTKADFDTFKILYHKTDEGLSGEGFYFTPSKEYSKRYGDKTLSLYLSVQNMLEIQPTTDEEYTEITKGNFKPSDKNKDLAKTLVARYRDTLNDAQKQLLDWDMQDNMYDSAISRVLFGNKDAKQILKEQGYDGVKYIGKKYDLTEYTVYNNTQIKSVDNRGTYSSDTGNIYFQTTEDVSVRPETARINYLENNLAEWQEFLDTTIANNTNNWNAEILEDNRKRAKKAISNIKKEIKELQESLKEPIEEKLYATHNMSLAGVKGALKLGGLAMPSLAIRKVSQGNINQFGDIVFVGGTKLVEPSKTTEVYDRDAWTPSLAYNMRYELNDKGKKFITDVANKHKSDHSPSVFLYNIEENIDTPKSNSMAMQLYCLDRGIDYDSISHYELSNSLDYLTWYEENITGNSDPYLWAENADNTDMKKYKYTLDNMMRILKRQERSGGGFIGDTVLTTQHLLQFMANKYKNLQEIKANKNKLVSREEQTNAISEIDEAFYQLADELKLDGKTYEHYENRTGLAIAAINKESEIKENLDRYNLDSSDESVEKVKQFTQKMKDVVTDYFEVKPRRIVDFNEFSGVIVPNGAEYDDVASRLENSGLFVQRVDKGNESEYQDALMEIQRRYKTVLFQSQKRGVIRGQYDPELQAILLTKYWNETTLVHEYHHRFLEKLFNYFKQAQTGERAVPDAFMTDMQQLFNILDIDPTQDQLTVVQQEKFATMVEAYLTGLGVDHPENLAFQSFLHWIPEQYQSILNLGYLDEQGNIVNPVLDEQTIAWFNKWFANPFMPSLSTAPEIQHLTNPTDTNGEIIPSSQKVMNNREKDWGQDSEEQNKADAQLWRAINENTPNDMRAALDGEKERMKAESNNQPDDTKLPEEHKPTMREKWFKTYQPSARERAAQMAREYLTKNPEHARELAFADPETSTEFDAPVDRAMLIRAVMETVPHGSDEWYILNDNLATVKSMSGSTLSLAGDESHRAYLDAKREVEDARELKAAVNYAGTRRGALEKWNSDIKAFIAKRTAQIVATEPNSIERKTAIKAFLEEAKTKFSANTTNAVLNQMDLTGMQTKNSQVFIKWAEKQIKQATHAKIDATEQKELMKASIAAQLALKDIDSTAQTDGKFTRAVQSAKDIRHWQFVKDKMKKAYIGRWGKWGIFTENLFGGYVPSAMLMSVNTLFFANVPSTAINTGTIRLAAKAIGKNNVDKQIQKDEIERIRQVFNASGVNLAQMDKPTSPSTLHGEKYMNTEQKHWYNFTFEILGRTDNIFRIPTFVDALARIATKNADGDKAKATALFKAYAQLNNKDESAKTARKQALAVANMAVFTQDGTLSTALNHIRSILNTLSRAPLGLDPNGFGLGNVLAPFLKTGANITEMGLSATLALPRTAIIGLKKLQGKQIPDLDKIAIRADWMNLAWTAVMVALLCALSGDDDDWYTEPYQSGRKYDPNKPYDSIRFGNTWVKLDVFGPVAIPLRTAAMTIKDWEKRKLASIGDGMFEALSDTPLVQQFTDSSLDYMNRQPGAYWSGFAYNQANKFVPAQAKTLAKAISRKTGAKLDTTGAGKTIDRKFHRNYGFDGAELTTNDLINVLTNRLKYNPQ